MEGSGTFTGTLKLLFSLGRPLYSGIGSLPDLWISEVTGPTLQLNFEESEVRNASISETSPDYVLEYHDHR